MNAKPNNSNDGSLQPIDEAGRYAKKDGTNSVSPERLKEAKKATKAFMNKPINDKTKELLDSMKKEQYHPQFNPPKYEFKTRGKNKGQPKGRLAEYYKPIDENKEKELKEYYDKAILVTNGRFVDFDSFKEAYKNYHSNKREYDRSAFMQMIKKQTDEMIKKRYIERNREKFNHLVETSNQEAIINDVNEQYFDVTNKQSEINKAIRKNKMGLNKTNIAIKDLKKQLRKKGLSNYSRGNLINKLTRLQRQARSYKGQLTKLSKATVFRIKSIKEIQDMFKQDPKGLMSLVQSHQPIQTQTNVVKPKTEEEKAMELLFSATGGK